MERESQITDSSKNTLHWIVFALILAVGVIIRILLLDRPIGLDEAYSFLEYGAVSPLRSLRNYSATNNHLLNSLLMHVAFRIFGAEFWAIRLPAFLFGAATIPAAYIVGRIAVNRFVGLIAAGIVAFSVSMIDYSTNARGFAMVAFFTVVQFGLALLILKQSRAWLWVAYAITLALGFFSVTTYVLPAGTVSLWLLISLWIELNGTARIKAIRSFIITIFAGAALTLAFYAPIWTRSGFGVLLDNRSVDIYSLEYYGIDMPLWMNLQRIFTFAFRGWMMPAGAAIAALMLMGIVLHRRVSSHRIPVLMIAAGWALPFMLFLPYVPPMRTWIYLIPLGGIALGTAFAGIAHRTGRATPLFAGIMALLLAFGAVTSADYAFVDVGDSPDAPLIAASIRQLADNDLAMIPQPNSEPVRYYLYREGNREAPVLSEQFFPSELLRNTLASGGRVYAFVDAGRTFDDLIALYGVDTAALPLEFVEIVALPSGTLGEVRLRS